MNEEEGFRCLTLSKVQMIAGGVNDGGVPVPGDQRDIHIQNSI